MKSAFKPLFLAIALLLHAVLIAAGYFGFFEQKPAKKHQPPSALTVSILRPPGPSAAPAPVPAKPAPPLPAPPAAKSQEKPVKRRPKPPVPKSPIPKPTPQPIPETAKPIPAPSAPKVPSPPMAEADSPSVPTSSPSVPVKTGVAISATYAASNQKPDYPAVSRRYGEEGTVVLNVLVREDGTAGDVKLKTSSGFPLLDKSAINTVKTWRFNPATSDGKPIAEWYPVPITFKLDK